VPVTVRTRRDEEARAEQLLAMGKFLVTERLCRPADGGPLVTEDKCLGGGNLVYLPGMEIPIAEARAVGLAPEVELAAAAAPASSEMTLTPAAAPRGKRK
jgi:hypothetical protein